MGKGGASQESLDSPHISTHIPGERALDRSDGHDNCRHIQDVNLQFMRRLIDAKCLKNIREQRVKCGQCNLTRGLWLCCHRDCGSIGCGRMSKGQHALKHYEKTKGAKGAHAVAVNLTNCQVWCYECDNEVVDEYSGNAAQIRSLLNPEVEQGSHAPALLQDTSAVGLVGLSNLGNTCYMSAALQSLSNTRQFRSWMLNVGSGHFDVFNATPRGQMITSFVQLMSLLWSESAGKEPISPNQFLKHVWEQLPRFKGHAQQDAQEFLSGFLDVLHEEAKEVRPKLPDDTESSEDEEDTDENGKPKPKPKKSQRYHSIVSDVFQGRLRSEVQCTNCSKVSKTTDFCYEISVPIPGKKQRQKMQSNGEKASSKEEGSSRGFLGSIGAWFGCVSGFERSKVLRLEDCLNQFSTTELLTGDDKYKCEHCKGTHDAQKTLSIQELPEILIVHIKRFRFSKYDSYFGSKLSNPVIFPLDDLDMSPFLGANHASGSRQYKLIAVINHQGVFGGGHYIAYALNSENNRWYEYNDHTVREVTKAEVQRTEAYVLFYERKGDRDDTEIDKVMKSVENAKTLDSSSSGYPLVSSSWYNKFLTFSSAPKINNEAILCKHRKFKFHGMNRNFAHAVPMPQTVLQKLQASYGGDAQPVYDTGPCEECEREMLALRVRREEEKRRITELDRTFIEPLEDWYLIDATWLSEWREFTQESNSLSPPPGPITNGSLLDKDGKPKPNLIRARHYRGVNKDVWDLFVSIYGGGPPIPRAVLDIYHQ